MKHMEYYLARHARKLLKIGRQLKHAHGVPFDCPVQEYPPSVAASRMDISLLKRVGASPPQANLGNLTWLQYSSLDGTDPLENLFFAAAKLGGAAWIDYLARQCFPTPFETVATGMLHAIKENIELELEWRERGEGRKH